LEYDMVRILVEARACGRQQAGSRIWCGSVASRAQGEAEALWGHARRDGARRELDR